MKKPLKISPIESNGPMVVQMRDLEVLSPIALPIGVMSDGGGGIH